MELGERGGRGFVELVAVGCLLAPRLLTWSADFELADRAQALARRVDGLTRTRRDVVKGAVAVATFGVGSALAGRNAAAAAADNVKVASKTLEIQSQQLGNQVTQFLGRIRAA